MSATAEIKVLTKENVLAIPLNALVGDEETLVDVLTVDAGGNQTVKRVEIELGIFGDSFAEVTKGLTAGDQVITGVSGDVPAPVNFGPPPGARTGA
jgi:multidrug efflux pump subunit AcrA (membrane-fusion protein)